VANPSTITGSIGVRMELVNIRGLAEKIGLGQTLIASGDMKGAGSPFRELSPAEREYLTSVVMDMHEQFVNDIAEARSMDRAQVAPLADGRAFTGRQALDLGLVDQLGGYQDALDRLRAQTGLAGRVPLKEGPSEKNSLLIRILSAVGVPSASEIKAWLEPRWVFYY